MMVKVPISFMEDLAKMLDKLTEEGEDKISWPTINRAKKMSQSVKENYTEIKPQYDRSN